MEPFYNELLNLSQESIIKEVSDSVCGNLGKKFVALHVSALLNMRDIDYLKSLEGCHLYADGISVVLLARRWGLERIERAPTTDIAPIALINSQARLGRQLVVGLVGGDAILSKSIRRHFETVFGMSVAFAVTGYPDEWGNHEIELISKRVDVVLVGMGVPRESIFLRNYADKMNFGVALTCGGLFRFLIGDEKRSPLKVQQMGLEWVWRLFQDPRRLIIRYLRGSAIFLRLYVSKS